MKSLTLIRVSDIGDTPDGQRGMVVLEDLEQRFCLAFATDPHETQRLAREMGRARCACNPVYDFIQSLLAAFQARITRVVLDDAGERGITAFVNLAISPAGDEMTLRCYPPDALALALRSNAPIYATRAAFAHAVPRSPRHVLPAGSNVSRWLERLNPGDF